MNNNSLKTIHMPKVNNCLCKLSYAFIEAFKFYCCHLSPKREANGNEAPQTINGSNFTHAPAADHEMPAASPSKCIVFVVDADESNLFDQLKLQQSITSKRLYIFLSTTLNKNLSFFYWR